MWNKTNSQWYLGSLAHPVEKLDLAIYRVAVDPFDNLYLIQTEEVEFEFKHKVYGIEDEFVGRAVRTFNNTSGNLGVLLNGLQGTGKSVTAKLLCNGLKLPVILVDFKHKELSTFLSKINDDCIVFIDEYEKIFNHYDSDILSLMDGALDNPKSRKVFLLTTNELSVSRYLLQRPSRIRYVKTFNDLSLEVITQIVDDRLINLNHRQKTLDYLSSLESITVDIVKSVVEEVNIHNEEPSIFAEVFNTKIVSATANVYKKNLDQIPEIVYSGKINIFPFIPSHLQKDLYVDNTYLGTIKKVHSQNTVTVEVEDENDKMVLETYTIEPERFVHKSFLF